MKINLKNFPSQIYLLLDKETFHKLMNQLSQYKLKNLSKKIGVSITTILEWKKRHQFISLQNLRKINKILKISETNIEKNIIAYKTKRGKFEIKNPKIPIKDSQELREIVIHIMCDGCFGGGYAAYYNIDDKTKKEFIDELKKCFGDIGFKIYKDHVHFPSAIPLILKHFLGIDFNSKQCRVPKKFFKGNRHKLIGIPRAIIIDEGTIDGSNVRIDSCNKEFLEDVKKICNKLRYNCGKTWESKGPIFRFNILANSLQKLNKDMKRLPLTNKESLIKLAINNQERIWKYKLPGDVKKEILELLSKKPMKNIDLILKIKLSKTAIGKHLIWLKKNDFTNYKVDKNKRIYFIKDKNKAERFINNPSEFIKSNKIKNYGLSQLKLLRILDKSIKRYGEIEKYFGFNKAATFKLVSSLKKKGFIKKINKKGWIITNKGKKILSLNKEKARYLLYANIKKI